MVKAGLVPFLNHSQLVAPLSWPHRLWTWGPGCLSLPWILSFETESMYHRLAWVSGPLPQPPECWGYRISHCIWLSSRSLNPHLCVHWLINHVLLKSHWMCIWISPYHDPLFVSGPLGHSHDGCQQVFLILLCFTFWHLVLNISFVLKIYPLINGLISVETWEAPTLVLSANTVIDFQGLLKKPILRY